MAKVWVFTPPTSSTTALTNFIYPNAAGGVVSIPWSADALPARGGWETSSGSASAGYSYTNFDSVINNQLSFGAKKVVIVLSPISFGGSNNSTPSYVFTAGWAASLPGPPVQLYTAASSDYTGSGAISPGSSAQGVDNTAFPAAWTQPFKTAWENAIADALAHMAAASYKNKIEYVRIGGGAGGEWFPFGTATATAGLLTIPGGPTTVAQLKTVWISQYMSDIETFINAQSSGFKFVQSLDGGFATENIPYQWADDEATLAVSNGFGIGCQGLKSADATAFTNHGFSSGGSNVSGYPSMDHAFNFLNAGATRRQFQTSAASDPTGATPPGSLVTMLSYATNNLSPTDIEVYYADWKIAYDSTDTNYNTYHVAYQAALLDAGAGLAAYANYPDIYMIRGGRPRRPYDGYFFEPNITGGSGPGVHARDYNILREAVITNTGVNARNYQILREAVLSFSPHALDYSIFREAVILIAPPATQLLAIPEFPNLVRRKRIPQFDNYSAFVYNPKRNVQVQLCINT